MAYKRLIINYEEHIDPQIALLLILKTVQMGRISQNNTSFCAVGSFGIDDKEYLVIADKTPQNSDTFKVIYDRDTK